MAEEELGTEAGSEETKTGQFAPQKIYIKDLSFETPHSPEVFTEEWNPVVNMNIASEAKPIDKKLYEVVLTVTVTVTMEEKTAYLVEAHQAGIFHIDGFSEEIIARMVATICPNILFPFARELVADLVTRGGFPQLLLAPVNFEALYQQEQRHQQQNVVPPTEAETKH
ncbi:MAG: protein-export chaperone SecB [Proteobacteria bacterium]|nr:protein-export chaperone SecB [Pseudomonadota bacterium]